MEITRTSSAAGKNTGMTYRSLGNSDEARGKSESRSKTVKSICKAIIEDPSKQLERLVQRGVIDSSTASRVRKHISTSIHSHHPQQHEKLEAILGRALGIQALYRDSHDVLVHAQSSTWRVHSDLVKELMKLRNPEQDLHQFKCLRMPRDNTENGIEKYSKSSSESDNTFQGSHDIIAADSYLFNTEKLESAMSFLNNNSSCNLASSKQIQAHCRDVLQFFYPKMSSSDLSDYAGRITSSYSAGTETTGNLLVFCIPKEISDRVQYRSHELGKPCNCHSERSDREILDELQSGTLDENNRCTYPTYNGPFHPPQARIFTPALNKKDGIEIYQLVSDKNKRKAEKTQVRELASEIHQRFKPTQTPGCAIL